MLDVAVLGTLRKWMLEVRYQAWCFWGGGRGGRGVCLCLCLWYGDWCGSSACQGRARGEGGCSLEFTLHGALPAQCERRR